MSDEEYNTIAEDTVKSQNKINQLESLIEEKNKEEIDELEEVIGRNEELCHMVDSLNKKLNFFIYIVFIFTFVTMIGVFGNIFIFSAMLNIINGILGG